MKKSKVKKIYKVYCTYFPDGTYYIGFSSKSGLQYEKYFGSSKQIISEIKNNPSHGLKKVTIAEFEKKSHGRAVEHILQWKNRNDPLMRNDMFNIRIKLSFLKGLVFPNWKP